MLLLRATFGATERWLHWPRDELERHFRKIGWVDHAIDNRPVAEQCELAGVEEPDKNTLSTVFDFSAALAALGIKTLKSCFRLRTGRRLIVRSCRKHQKGCSYSQPN